MRIYSNQDAISIRSENKSIEYLEIYMNPSVESNPQETAIQYYTYQQMYRNVGEH